MKIAIANYAHIEIPICIVSIMSCNYRGLLEHRREQKYYEILKVQQDGEYRSLRILIFITAIGRPHTDVGQCIWQNADIHIYI